MRRRLSGARCLVTGASAGIGRALTHQLAAQGARLLVTARRADRLHELERCASPSGSVASLAGDVTDPAHRRDLAQWIREHWQGLDVLVNNAGVGALGPFATSTEERLRQVMEVNFFAAVEMARACLPALRQGKHPAIVNISSVLGHRAVPNKAEYCASKFALHGWSDSVRLELQADGIDVILVSPSTTDSEFFDSLLASDAPDARLKSRPMPPEQVARHTIRALQRGRREVILTAGGKLLVWIDRLCPPLADYLIRRGSG